MLPPISFAEAEEERGEAENKNADVRKTDVINHGKTFADIGATVCDILDVPFETKGESFLDAIRR